MKEKSISKGTFCFSSHNREILTTQVFWSVIPVVKDETYPSKLLSVFLGGRVPIGQREPYSKLTPHLDMSSVDQEMEWIFVSNCFQTRDLMWGDGTQRDTCSNCFSLLSRKIFKRLPLPLTDRDQSSCCHLALTISHLNKRKDKRMEGILELTLSIQSVLIPAYIWTSP